MSEKVLLVSRPAMFRNHPIWFTVCLLLCLVGIGFFFLIPWWIQCHATKLTITDKRTTLRQGILSKHTNDVFHDNVRNVQVYQTPLQRLLNVGDIGISSAGQAGIEIEVHGIRNPAEIRSLIDQHRES